MWYNTIYGIGTARIIVPFTGSVVVLLSEEESFELNSPDFDEVDVGKIEVAEYELSPCTMDDDPFYDICPDCGKPIGLINDGGNGFCSDCASSH